MLELQAAELDFIRSCHVADEKDFLEKCCIYGDFLYETNQTLNLTRIPAEEFWSKHVCDSLAIAREVKFPDSTHHMKMCDVGCGGGWFTRAFTKCGYQMTGLDKSAEMLDFAQDPGH